MKTTIIPQIKDIDVKTEALNLSDFVLSDSVLRIFPRATEVFSENGCPNLQNPSPTQEGTFPIVYVPSPLSAGEYRIIARKDKIEISAADSQGLMYGLFTLSELHLINDAELIEFDAFDKPTLTFRAVSDDLSRGQLSTMDNFFLIIRRLARYKYNTYMPYLEDTFRYESVPAWGRYSNPIGKEEWQVIISYAKSWNLDVRPIINLLGHFDKLCRIEELQPLALRRRDGSICHMMDPKKPEVRTTIHKMLKEVVDCFGKGIIHCGGDEPVDLTEVYGKSDGGKLFIEHYTWVSAELHKLGCTMMLYADFFAPPWGDYAVPVGRVRELPQGAEFVFWDYAVREQYPLVDALHRQNVPLLISPGSWTWNRFSCDIRQCYGNTMGLLKADAGRSRGMIMSSWADGGDTLRELVWPGVLVGANFSWSPSSTYDYDACVKLLHKSFYGFDEAQTELLDPVYHYDRILRRGDEDEFRKEMFRSPFEPVAFKDWENIPILQAALRKASADLASMKPKRNRSGFEALRLTVARAAFTANKIAALPHEELRTQEQAIPFADRALTLAGEVPMLKELHRQLWFAENRMSEWEQCAVLYDDLYDQLRMFSRNCRTRKIFNRK